VIRYSTHLNLPGFGPDAQQKLAESTVLLVGADGLGCPAALYLMAAGLGKLILIDDAQVELNNLQRQVLHTEDRLGQPKVLSAKYRLQETQLKR
jgi:molybdopterin/thiamine biosynthesis adenylyltransferase